MNLINTSILSLSAGAMEAVEISTYRLVQLERLAGFGRLSILVIIIISVIIAFLLAHKFYWAVKTMPDVRKIAKSVMRDTVEESVEDAIRRECEMFGSVYDAVEKAIKDACNYGIVYDEIRKQINCSCRYGDIYQFVRHDVIPQKYEETQVHITLK